MKVTRLNIADVKNALETNLVKTGDIKMTQKEAFANDLCMVCGKPALARCSTDAGVKEYYISATCEVCFDQMFSEE